MNDIPTSPDVSLSDELAALRAIVEGTARHTGQEFFQSLVRHLAAAVGTRTPSWPSLLAKTERARWRTGYAIGSRRTSNLTC
jgi:hypothetical protein